MTASWRAAIDGVTVVDEKSFGVDRRAPDERLLAWRPIDNQEPTGLLAEIAVGDQVKRAVRRKGPEYACSGRRWL
jgi:hypothetical protein